MKLISCEGCGVVLDTDNIHEPSIYINDEAGQSYGDIDEENALWINREYVPAIECPCCKTKISYFDGSY